MMTLFLFVSGRQCMFIFVFPMICSGFRALFTREPFSGGSHGPHGNPE